MQKIEIVSYFGLGSLIATAIRIANAKDAGAVIAAGDRQSLNAIIKEIEDDLKAVDLVHSIAQVEHTCKKLDEDTITFGGVKAKLESLRVAVRSELKTTFVGYIPAGRARFWDQEKPFGPHVFDNFPSARTDLTAAGNCYAIEQYTACVFHCMRVAEKGLRALARERKIKAIKDRPLEWNDWGKILGAIEAKANELAGKMRMGHARDKALEFYRDAAGELYGFKDAYRNYVTHDRADYDMGQASSVYHRVGEFMQRLATKLNETDPKPIKWKSK